MGSGPCIRILPVFLAELFQQLCSLNWKFFWPEISFEATGGRHISRDYEGGRRGGGDDIGDTTELLGDTTLKGGTTQARGDDTEGGDDIRGTPHVVPPSWGTPHVVPPSVVSPYVIPPSVSSPLARVIPPSVWCLLGALWCPLCHPPPPCRPPSPVSSPPSVWCLLGALWCPLCRPLCRPPPLRVIPPRPCRPPSPVSSPPSVWCLLGALWCPLCRPPPSVSSLLARVVPPFSVVSPRRVGQHVVSPVSSPLTRVVPPCPCPNP